MQKILLSFLFTLFIFSNLHGLTFGVVPQQSPVSLVKSWNPIIKYLEKKSGQKIELKLTESITKFEEELYTGKYDIAYMNPYHYVIVSKNSNYTAKIRANKNLVGILVVNKTNELNNITDLKGKKFLFPSPNAFAATLLPKYELLKNFNINVNKDEIFYYVNSHDSVYKGIARGIGDIGGGIERTFNAINDNQTKNSLKIIYKTQPYPSHPIAFNKSLSKDIEKSLVDAFMNIPEELLKNLKIKTMIKTNDSEYNIIRDLSKELNKE